MKNIIKKEDLLYSAGFPINIDTTKLVVVQIGQQDHQGVILYTCSTTGHTDKSGLPIKLNKEYKEGIYIIR